MEMMLLEYVQYRYKNLVLPGEHGGITENEVYVVNFLLYVTKNKRLQS